MVKCTGKTCIPISLDAVSKFFNRIVPEDKLSEFNIKLDGRANVKSVYAKLEGTTLTIYTGGVLNSGSVHFPNLSSQALLILLIIFGIKKAGMGQSFEIKAADQSVAECLADQDFVHLQGQLQNFCEKFVQLYPNAFVEDVQPVNEKTVVQSQPLENQSNEKFAESKPKAKKTSSKKNAVDESVFIPLENTPKIECPADLDLTQV